MKSFVEALCSNKRSEKIPEAYDYFGDLIGKWTIEWNDHLDEAVPRRVKGERIFSRVLEGTAIKDLMIYNPRTMVWDIFYGCTGSGFRLTAVKVGDEVVLTENTEGKMRYVFSEITANTFKWRKECLPPDDHWKVVAIVEACRI